MVTVENVLKSGRPKKDADFKEHVFSLLLQHGRPKHLRSSDWTHQQYLDVADELKQLARDNADGSIDGFAKALESPHSLTRKVAVEMLNELATSSEVAEGRQAERIREFVKRALADANRKVRCSTINTIRNMAIDDNVKRKEFAPLMVDLLADASKRVRGMAPWVLSKWPESVPLEAAARVLVMEDPQASHGLRMLTNEIISAPNSH